MASLASRTHLLEQTIKSLLPQVDALCVYLNGHTQVPRCLKHPKILHAILSREAGWRGAEAKLWFWDDAEFKAVPRWDRDTIAFTCDDDIIYPRDYVERMTHSLSQHPGSIVCVHSSIMEDPFVDYSTSRVVAGCRDSLREDTQCHIPGTGTMAFRYGDFKVSLRGDFEWSNCVDPHVARMAAQQNVPIWSVQRPNQWLRPLPLPLEGMSIFNQRVGGGIDAKETEILKSAPIADIPRHARGFRRRNVLRHLKAQQENDIVANPKAMLPQQAFEFLESRLPQLREGYVVELGSGHGTRRLISMLPAGVQLISVEHDHTFVGLVKGAHYIYAPLVNGWYDGEVLGRELPAPDRILALIVDGPPRVGRSGLLGNLHRFPKQCGLLVDDLHRPEELQLFTRLAGDHGEIHHCEDGRSFGTAGWC